MKVKITIKLVDGRWYAVPGNNNKATRLLLVSAINFCKERNRREKR